jgi:hypothetical protein
VDIAVSVRPATLATQVSLVTLDTQGRLATPATAALQVTVDTLVYQAIVQSPATPVTPVEVVIQAHLVTLVIAV